MGFSSVATAKQQVAAGKMVPLAMKGRERSTALSGVPTLRELGFSDPLYEAGVFANRGLSRSEKAAGNRYH